MIAGPEGNAVVYCEGAFGTTNGKTAHGLVRFTKRYRILSVIDSTHAGKDAGEVLDGKVVGIPVFASIDDALEAANSGPAKVTHLVIGLAPDGGRLSPRTRKDINNAVRLGLNIDCGLHDYLTDDIELVKLAEEHNSILRDIRKPPDIKELHFFSGRIDKVESFKIAYLGTDSAVGKRTSSIILTNGLLAAGISAELIGTGQTSWMQGFRYGIILDSLVNDFVAGEIEHAVCTAWDEVKPDVIIIEGQGSLMNPAYPGGFEILAATRPDVVILQHAPARRDYDGFPGNKIHTLKKQIHAIELVSGRPVIAVTINHEGLKIDEVDAACEKITRSTGLTACDPILDGPAKLIELISNYIKKD